MLITAYEKLTHNNEIVEIAHAQVRCKNVNGNYQLFHQFIRIDRRTKGNIRVDRCSILSVGPTTPYEAIDDGQGFKTVREAKQYVRRYLLEQERQETLVPNTKGLRAA